MGAKEEMQNKAIIYNDSERRTHSYACYNPKCEQYGQYVPVTVGPPAPDGKGYYFVCDYCGELLTTPVGFPISFDPCAIHS